MQVQIHPDTGSDRPSYRFRYILIKVQIHPDAGSDTPWCRFRYILIQAQIQPDTGSDTPWCRFRYTLMQVQIHPDTGSDTLKIALNRPYFYNTRGIWLCSVSTVLLEFNNSTCRLCLILRKIQVSRELLRKGGSFYVSENSASFKTLKQETSILVRFYLQNAVDPPSFTELSVKSRFFLCLP